MIKPMKFYGFHTEYRIHCDNCDARCNIGQIGNAITVSFPYGHKLDSLDENKHFCSDKCLVEYITRKTEEVMVDE